MFKGKDLIGCGVSLKVPRGAEASVDMYNLALEYMWNNWELVKSHSTLSDDSESEIRDVNTEDGRAGGLIMRRTIKLYRRVCH